MPKVGSSYKADDATSYFPTWGSPPLTGQKTTCTVLLTQEHHPQGNKQMPASLTLSRADRQVHQKPQQNLEPLPQISVLTVSILPHGRATEDWGRLLFLSAQQTLLLLQAPPHFLWALPFSYKAPSTLPPSQAKVTLAVFKLEANK